MSTSLNGWPVLPPGSSYLHTWALNLDNDDIIERRITCRQGSVGFVLMHLALWFDDKVERLDITGEPDDGAYSYRQSRSGGGWSNHSSGTAMDLNWLRHPWHTQPERSFTAKQITAIHKRLDFYSGIIDWGGDWSDKYVDPMHFEIAPGTEMSQCEAVAKRLLDSPRGKRLLAANPGQREVILS